MLQILPKLQKERPNLIFSITTLLLTAFQARHNVETYGGVGKMSRKYVGNNCHALGGDFSV